MNKFASKVTVEEMCQMQVLITSDCCGEYLSDLHIDHGICPCCLEHCELVIEKIPA